MSIGQVTRGRSKESWAIGDRPRRFDGWTNIRLMHAKR
ncbi:hypothetical protein NJ7G_3740 [Natrinema sp. J7-2]|nr:hypothetical protein NJ7G_3740 [Natrinema sp. J7-2]